jgi:preprotein translocase subunit SecF
MKGEGRTMATRATKAPDKPAERSAGGTQHRFFELIPPGLDIDFVGLRFKMLILSWALIAVGLMSVWLKGGLNYGIDFAGGTMVHVKFDQPTSVGDVRAALSNPALKEIVVQNVGKEGREFQVRVLGADQGGSATVADAIKGGLKDKFGEGTYEIMRVETVGPKVGRDLWRDASLAVLVATLIMGAYIAARFELRFGVGAAVALVHDVLMTIGALSIANMEFDLTTVAALLTVVGYSVHDTVIVSDRIRENMRKMRRETLARIINVSINETLARTLITSGTAILVTAALFVLGGAVIHSFAFALLVGFIVGTYSSIYVASPIVLYLEGRSTARR